MSGTPGEASLSSVIESVLSIPNHASDRLRGVTWSYRVEQSDSEVLGALLTRDDSIAGERWFRLRDGQATLPLAFSLRARKD